MRNWKQGWRMLALLAALGWCWTAPAVAQLGDIAGFRPGAGSGSGGAPNVTVVSPGVNPAVVAWANETTYQFGEGLSPVTPSNLSSNILAGNSFTGVRIADKTNITILGVYGQSIWDGSSAHGEVLHLTNCLNVRIWGITFRGYTNHATALFPTTMNVWAGVHHGKCVNLTIENCIIERHLDHGICDAGSSLGSANFSRMSSNTVIRGSYFTDIGGWRGTGSDGTAIVCTDGVVEDNHIEYVYRGIEPFADALSPQDIWSTRIRRNTIIDAVNAGIVTFGTTNSHFSVCSDNYIYNKPQLTYHGTNFGGTYAYSGTGIFISGGRSWTIQNNLVRGGWLYGMVLFNSASKFDDAIVTGNTVADIDNRGSQGAGYYLGEPLNTAASASSVRNLYFANNMAINCLEAGLQLWAGRDVQIIDNVFKNCDFSTGDSTLATAVRLGWDSASTAPLTNITVRGNKVYCEDATSAYGFYIENNVSSMVFENNEVVTNAASVGVMVNHGITNRSGANVTVIGAPRQFYATIDLPSIGVNSQFTTNFTAEGASTNDAVVDLRLPAQFYASGNTTNLLFNAWASNATVYVKFSNNDAVTAADAPSVRMVATVKQVQIHGQ